MKSVVSDPLDEYLGVEERNPTMVGPRATRGLVGGAARGERGWGMGVT